ncbi:MAG: KTSC domain-containing protein [Burkholderiaceae bacterium]
MQRQKLHGGKLRSAGYDPVARELEIEFSNRDVRIFIGVPDDVWRRLLSAPNPATYYEDRIEDEYAFHPGQRDQDTNAQDKLNDLFSGGSSQA